MREVYGMTSGLVKWDDRSRNSRGEDGILDHGWVEMGSHFQDEKSRKLDPMKLTLNCESIGSKRD